VTIKKKPAKKKSTPVGRITNALRRIWLWSPERAEVVKRAGKYCEECGVEGVFNRKDADKTGKPRLEIHHVEPCDMTQLAKMIHKRMFPGADKLDCLCVDCHRKADAIIQREYND